MPHHHRSVPVRPALVLGAIGAQALAGGPPPELAKLTEPSPGENRIFGDTCDLHDGLAIVGAGGVSLFEVPGDAFLFDATTGVLLAQIPAIAASTKATYVEGVAAGPGRVLVGTSDNAPFTYPRLVRLFDTADPTNPVLVREFVPSDSMFNDSFGEGMAISGTTAIIGAPFANIDGVPTGAAYLFDTTTGDELGKLVADDGQSVDLFGGAVDIDGTTVLVGARRDDDLGAMSGSAYLFDVSDSMNPVQTAKFFGSDVAADDMFGFSVAIDGNLVLIGAIFDDDNGLDAGAAYLFDISDLSNPVELRKITPSDANATDDFGWDVSLDGTSALITSRTDDDLFPGGGSAYLYDLTDPANPVEVSKITPSDPSANQVFGWSGAIDAGLAVIGASMDDAPGENAGSAYLFDISTGPSPCSVADLAEPFGSLNFNDVIVFLNAFGAMDPAADLAEPIGTFNFNDVIEFLTLFAAGCP